MDMNYICVSSYNENSVTQIRERISILFQRSQRFKNILLYVICIEQIICTNLCLVYVTYELKYHDHDFSIFSVENRSPLYTIQIFFKKHKPPFHMETQYGIPISGLLFSNVHKQLLNAYVS